jgi:hypothetical protein
MAKQNKSASTVDFSSFALLKAIADEIRPLIRGWLVLLSLGLTTAALANDKGLSGRDAIVPVMIGEALKDSKMWRGDAARFVDSFGRVIDIANGYSSYILPLISAGIILLLCLCNCLRWVIFALSSSSRTEKAAGTTAAGDTPTPCFSRGRAASKHDSHSTPISPRSRSDASVEMRLFARQIEVAAESCKRRSHTVGLIYFEVSGNAGRRLTNGDASAHAMMEAISAECGHVLHGSAELKGRDGRCPWIKPLGAEDLEECDCRACGRYPLGTASQVKILNDNQIIIVVCMLTGYDALKHIGWRLRRVVRSANSASDRTAPTSMGYAIFPLDGYDGVTLIDAARVDYSHSHLAPVDRDN